jgi:serine/threonine protein kinase
MTALWLGWVRAFQIVHLFLPPLHTCSFFFPCHTTKPAQEAGTVVLVQEYAAAGDLLSYMLRRGGCLSEARAIAMVLRPLLSALDYLHGQVSNSRNSGVGPPWTALT